MNMIGEMKSGRQRAARVGAILLVIATLFAAATGNAADTGKVPNWMAEKSVDEAKQMLEQAGFTNIQLEQVATTDNRFPRCYNDRVCGSQPEEGARNVPLAQPVILYVGHNFISVDASSFTPEQPKPGRDVISAMSPAWCDSAPEAARDPGNNRGGLERMFATDPYAEERLPTVLGLLCSNPDDDSIKAATASLLQGWINRTGLDRDAAIESFRQRVQAERWQQQKMETCNSLTQSAQSTEEAQLLDAARRQVFGCRDSGHDFTRLQWYLDRRGKPESEIIAAFLARNCFGFDEAPAQDDMFKVAKWPICSHDAITLDLDALAAQAKSAGYNDDAKTVSLEYVSGTRAFAQDFKRVVDTLADKDDAYEQLLVDVPTTAWDTWMERYDDHRKAIEAANTFEQALLAEGKADFAGCRDDLRENFNDYIDEQKPGTVEAFVTIATDPVGSILLDRLAACEAVTGNLNHAGMYFDILKQGRDQRGPRYAVHNAVIDALMKIRADKPDFPIEPIMLGGKPPSPLVDLAWRKAGQSKPRLTVPSTGIVNAVDDHADGLLVSFRQESYQAEEKHCVDTDKIWRLESTLNGVKIIYYQQCTSLGIKTFTRTADPVVIPRDAAAGIEPGVLAELAGDVTQQVAGGWRGFPISAYADAGRGALLSAYGFAIKHGDKRGTGGGATAQGGDVAGQSASVANDAGGGDTSASEEGGMLGGLARLLTAISLIAAGLVFVGKLLGEKVSALAGVARLAQSQARLVGFACLGVGLLMLLGAIFTLSVFANLLPMVACLLCGLLLFQGVETSAKTNPYVDMLVGGISKLAALTGPLAGQRMIIGLAAIAIGVVHLLFGQVTML